MFWNLLYRFCTLPWVYNWLYSRILENPYYHIKGPDGKTVYMLRGWVTKRGSWWQRLLRLNFCIRVHHILAPDRDRHLHSHPFNYRTIVLKGWYLEERFKGTNINMEGDTAVGTPETFHRISHVHCAGVVTLFIMWGGKRDDWGFMTPNGYVQAQDYFAMRNEAIWK